MRRIVAFSGCLFVSTAAATPSLADSFNATRTDTLVERANRTEVVLHRDYAQVRVEREVWNSGKESDQAMFHITPPTGGVAVSLRTLGTLDGQPHWFEGDLMEAEAAAHKYQELTGLGGYYPKDPALLSWRSADDLLLQVFPCPPEHAKKVGYDFVVPMKYEEGRFVLDLGPMGTETVSAKAHITVGPEGGAVLVDDERWDGGTTLTLDEQHSVAQVAPFRQKLEGHLASVPFGVHRNLVSWHVEAAPRLSTVPENARIVIIFDESRSIRSANREAPIVAARAYLEHFTNKRAKVLLMAFSRKPRELTKGFVTLAEAATKLSVGELASENGSEVDAALLYADTQLRDKAQGASARRIVLFTDELTREHLDVEAIGTKLRSGAILHIASMTQGSPYLSRVDEGSWASLSRSTGGVLWEGYAGGEKSASDNEKEVFEELVRPRKIDMLRLVSGAVIEEHEGETLMEGQGLSQELLSQRDAGFLTATGELWSKPVRLELKPDAAYGATQSALVFGSPLLSEITEPEMMKLALKGRAVSPVTSFLAIEPGVRPSTEGLEWDDRIGEAFGAGGLGLSGIGTSGGRVGFEAFDKAAWLGDATAPLAKACKVVTGSVHVELEATLDEVVKVEVQNRDGKVVESGCLQEGVWNLQLPTKGFTQSFERFTIPI